MHVPLLMSDWLDRAVRLYGAKRAVISDDDRVFTYAQLNERVNKLSRGLTELGIKQGDRVAYLSPNSVEMLEGFYGVMQIGAIMVSLNTRLKPHDYQFILNHSEAKVLFCDADLFQHIEPIIDQLETIESVILHYGESGGQYTAYDEWLHQFSGCSVERPEMSEDDVCSLLYTSGTTGNPKGVMLTHRNNYIHALATQHHLRVCDEDVYLHVLPMFHVNGWGAPFYYTGNGATQICLRKVDPHKIFARIEEYKVTSMHMAPTVLNGLIQYYQTYKPAVHHDLRVIIAGSAPPPAFVKIVEEEIGLEFIQVYGMTESSPLSTISLIRPELRDLPKEQQHRIKAKAGYPMVANDVKVIKPSGQEVVWNGTDIGEVVTRSNGVMKGYWKNEAATAETIKHGWLHTGDMGVIDEFGHIEIVDRKKDIIISGGENISSIEIEGVLYDHPKIVEAAVIALPHEKWGETPHAFVVVKPGETLTESEVIDFSRTHLAHFKAVTSVTFITELPKTASGKIQKVHLRNRAWEERGVENSGKFIN